MKLPKLSSATLIKRYKRFLADITLENGTETTIHCANTGAMTGCAEPGSTVWYSTSDNTKRKYPCSWELTQLPNNDVICINTAMANKVAIEAIENKVITQLADFDSLKAEVKYGEENSRIDILLSKKGNPACYIEVKSVTLLQNGQGYFPDAKTIRGQKHLRELMAMVEQGHRAVLLFTALHSGINSVSPADHIDPIYADLLREAIAKGVEVLAYKADINTQELTLNKQVPVVLNEK